MRLQPIGAGVITERRESRPANQPPLQRAITTEDRRPPTADHRCLSASLPPAVIARWAWQTVANTPGSHSFIAGIASMSGQAPKKMGMSLYADLLGASNAGTISGAPVKYDTNNNSQNNPSDEGGEASAKKKDGTVT